MHEATNLATAHRVGRWMIGSRTILAADVAGAWIRGALHLDCVYRISRAGGEFSLELLPAEAGYSIDVKAHDDQFGRRANWKLVGRAWPPFVGEANEQTSCARAA